APERESAKGSHMRTMRVLEISTDIGGAYCGWLLANLGAEVTRVAIDDATWRSPASPIALALAYLSQGKQAIAADNVDPTSYDAVISDSAEALQTVTGVTPQAL